MNFESASQFHMNSALNVKALVGAFDQEKALVGAFLLLRDCEIFANLRLKFYWIMVSCHQPITISPYASPSTQLRYITQRQIRYHLALL